MTRQQRPKHWSISCSFHGGCVVWQGLRTGLFCCTDRPVLTKTPKKRGNSTALAWIMMHLPSRCGKGAAEKPFRILGTHLRAGEGCIQVLQPTLFWDPRSNEALWVVRPGGSPSCRLCGGTKQALARASECSLFNSLLKVLYKYSATGEGLPAMPKYFPTQAGMETGDFYFQALSGYHGLCGYLFPLYRVLNIIAMF